MSLQTVPVKVERGVVHTMDGSPLPERAYALLVIMPATPADEEMAEWQAPFEAFFEQVRQHPPSESLDDLSSAELNDLVHSARQRK